MRSRAGHGALIVHFGGMRSISIRDIAAETGFSKSTVSLALRGFDSVAPETRERVLEAAKKMGYRANPLVSALMTQQRMGRAAEGAPTVGIVELYPTASPGTIKHLDRGFFAVRAAADLAGYQLNRFSIHNQTTMRPARLVQIIKNRGIPGIILIHGGDLDKSWQIDWSGHCVVELASPKPVYHSVKIDYISSARLVISEFRRRGYRRIGWVTPPSIEAYSNFRWRLGFMEYVWSLRPRDRVPLFAETPYTKESVLSWYHNYKPDVVFATGDTVMNWLIEGGVRIPEDVGFAAEGLLPDMIGKVAGLDTNYDLRMAEAIHLLDGLLRRNQVGPRNPPVVVNVPCCWVDGPTVRAVQDGSHQ